MKKVLFITLSLLTMVPLAHTQDKDDKNDNAKIVLVKEDNSDNYYYEGVVNVDGVSKEEMFKRAKQWVLSNLKTEDNNSQFDETNMSIYNSPTIIVKASKIYKNDYVNFKFKLQFKDGRYKFRFDNLIVQSNTENAPATSYTDSKKMFPRVLGKYNHNLVIAINEALVALSSDLQNSVKSGNANQNRDDNW